MKKKDLERFRTILEDSRTRVLMGAVQELKESPGRNRMITSDEMDFANLISESSLQGRLHDRKIRLLHKIEEALERIVSGEFGICEACDESISIKRLEVRPIAILCIPCKEDREREEKTALDENRTYPTRSIIHDWA